MSTVDQIVSRQERLVAAQALNMEERAELDALRKAVAELKERPDQAAATVDRLAVAAGLPAIADALAASYAPVDDTAKTIGFKMPEDLRLQILAMVEAYQAKSYKHLVLTCIRLGVAQLKQGLSVDTTGTLS